MTTTDLALVLDHGTWVTPAPGDTLITQGEPGDAFYAIGAGQVDVTRDGAPVVTLGPGDHFGEVALLTDAPRNATVTAHTAMRVFRLDRQGFIDVVARSRRAARSTSRTATWSTERRNRWSVGTAGVPRSAPAAPAAAVSVRSRAGAALRLGAVPGRDDRRSSSRTPCSAARAPSS
jgi:CRP-like cAMP-binding protein